MPGLLCDVGGYGVPRSKWVAVLRRAARELEPQWGVGLCYAVANAAEAAGLVGDRPGQPFEDRSDVYDALSGWPVFQDFKPPLSGMYWFSDDGRDRARSERFGDYRRTAALLMAERVRAGE